MKSITYTVEVEYILDFEDPEQTTDPCEPPKTEDEMFGFIIEEVGHSNFHVISARKEWYHWDGEKAIIHTSEPVELPKE